MSDFLRKILNPPAETAPQPAPPQPDIGVPCSSGHKMDFTGVATVGIFSAPGAVVLRAWSSGGDIYDIAVPVDDAERFLRTLRAAFDAARKLKQ